MQTRIEQLFRVGTRALGVAAIATVVAAGTVGSATEARASAVVSASAEPLDKIVLRNGRVIEGRIESETATEIRVVVVYAGIEAPTTYPRDQILSIQRGAGAATASDADTPQRTATAPGSRRPEANGIQALSGDRAPSVYHFRISGDLGTDIAVSPVRDVLEDVGKSDTNEFGEPTAPDYLILELDRRWADQIGADLSDDAVSFDETSLANDLISLIVKEMPQRWDREPEIVVWVKSAMGGVAFVPFVGDTIVFHPEGRMGGVGNLGQLFAGVGDEVVRQKQRSLRLARAQGLAIEGGYDYRLVNAMTMSQYELSYRFNGGVVELLERTPENPGEFLLTENGTIGSNVDSIRQRVTGTGNDFLTLKADTALRLGVSSGTAETLDDVLDILGIYRDHRMLSNRSERIMDQWSKALKRAERDLPKVWREYNEIQVGGTFQETRRAIGQRIRLLEDIESTLRRFDGDQANPALNSRRIGVPGPQDIAVMIERHRIQLIQARP
ncbi:MAG: hypothetical protein AAF297_03250 [Planctomycetota bacterium]